MEKWENSDTHANLYKVKKKEFGVRLTFDIKLGDHIYVLKDKPAPYEHHGIYIGNDKVIHFQNWVVTTSLGAFA